MSSVLTTDAQKRRLLPAWIREGLEKMEREKQKREERGRMEREKAEAKAAQEKAEKEAIDEMQADAKGKLFIKSKFVSILSVLKVLLSPE